MSGGAPRDVAREARTFIVLMALVAMLGDMTYEGGRGLVGPWLAFLGASATAVGFAAGLGEFLGYGLRLVTGWLGDRTRAWWGFVVAGYALNVVAVPGLALAGRWEAAVGLLLLERIGKAIRSPSRTTLVSWAASQAGPGKAFGFDEALDQLGAVTGPLLTALASWVVREEPVDWRYRVAFGVLLVPATLNVALVLLARRRFPRPEEFEPPAPAAHRPHGRLFRWYTVAGMLVALGFADWALVAFHAGRAGLLDASMVPVLYAGAMAVDAVAALVAGTLFDRRGPGVLAGTTLVSACFAPLAFLSTSAWGLAAGTALWAVGLGAQESVFKAAITRLVPRDERAHAYGRYFAFFGLAWWVGSTAMGWLYERSTVALVAFSAVTQLAAVPLFAWLGRETARGGETA